MRVLQLIEEQPGTDWQDLQYQVARILDECGLVAEVGKSLMSRAVLWKSIHCDWHAHHFIRRILNEVFGNNNFVNEIVWYYYNKLHDSRKHLLPRAHDTIFRYAKTEGSQIHKLLKERRDKPVTKLKYHKVNGQIQNIIGPDGKAVTYTSTERTIDDVWRIRCLQPANKVEWLNYDTQKPEDFIERIVTMSSHEDDLVADFFCGSGTTAAVAEKLGRKWIVTDLGKC